MQRHRSSPGPATSPQSPERRRAACAIHGWHWPRNPHASAPRGDFASYHENASHGRAHDAVISRKTADGNLEAALHRHALDQFDAFAIRATQDGSSACLSPGSRRVFISGNLHGDRERPSKAARFACWMIACRSTRNGRRGQRVECSPYIRRGIGIPGNHQRPTLGALPAKAQPAQKTDLQRSIRQAERMRAERNRGQQDAYGQHLGHPCGPNSAPARQASPIPPARVQAGWRAGAAARPHAA